MIYEGLFNVVGTDELEDMIFAICTTIEKAEKAQKLLEAEGFEDMITIVQSQVAIDELEIGGEIIEL